LSHACNPFCSAYFGEEGTYKLFAQTGLKTAILPSSYYYRHEPLVPSYSDF
jgi:hypothetical protein